MRTTSGVSFEPSSHLVDCVQVVLDSGLEVVEKRPDEELVLRQGPSPFGEGLFGEVSGLPEALEEDDGPDEEAHALVGRGLVRVGHQVVQAPGRKKASAVTS